MLLELEQLLRRELTSTLIGVSDEEELQARLDDFLNKIRRNAELLEANLLHRGFSIRKITRTSVVAASTAFAVAGATMLPLALPVHPGIQMGFAAVGFASTAATVDWRGLHVALFSSKPLTQQWAEQAT